MSIKILTDSSSDMTVEEAANLGVELIPLTIYFGDKTYKDAYEIKPDEFYRKLMEKKELPKTSQINTASFEVEFKKHLSENNEIIGIFISSNLSGTYQSAKISSKDFENVFIIDSKQTSVSLKILVMHAVKMRDEGKTSQEIITEIERLKTKVRLYAVIEDLYYLSKGGRLSSSSAIMGNLLAIKPIICCNNGKIEVKEKVRGTNKAYARVIELAKKEGLENARYVIAAHSLNFENHNKIKSDLMNMFDEKDILESRLGSAVGTYAGPLCAGVSFLPSDSEEPKIQAYNNEITNPEKI